jgi:glycine dehydrogenase subunit 2
MPAPAELDLPALSEPETMRHYVRLSRKNYAIDGPLSARLLHDEAQSAPQREDGAAAGLWRHPPAATALHGAGRLELIDELAHWLMVLTGTPPWR